MTCLKYCEQGELELYVSEGNPDIIELAESQTFLFVKNNIGILLDQPIIFM